VLNHAVATMKIGDEPILERNVVNVISDARMWHPLKRKTRIIPAEKLGAWVAAVEDLDNPKARTALAMMLFLGMRKSEVFGLQWADVDLASNPPMLTLPDPKNRRRFEVPLPASIADGLRGLHRETGHTPWVLPKGWDRKGEFEKGPLADIAWPLKKVNKATGLNLSYHDLRRTFATLSNALGHPDLTTKKLLNHADSGNVTSGYVQLEIETKAAALAGIEAHILARLREFRGVQQC
jgi:integrase